MFSISNSNVHEGSSAIKVACPLKKEDNYSAFKKWARSIEVTLEEHNFWDGKKGLPAILKDEKSKKKVLVFIENQVEKDLLEEVGEKLDGAELYLELKVRFEAKKMKEGSLYSLKKGNLTVSKLAATVEKLANSMALCLDIEVDVNDRIDAMLRALPSEYSLHVLGLRKEKFTYLFEATQFLEEIETSM